MQETNLSGEKVKREGKRDTMNDGGGGGNLMMADQNDTSRYALILSLHASDELHKKKLARSNDENMVRKWSEMPSSHCAGTDLLRNSLSWWFQFHQSSKFKLVQIEYSHWRLPTLTLNHQLIDAQRSHCHAPAQHHFFCQSNMNKSPKHCP